MVLTGQDYPLRPVPQIAGFLATRPATSWVRHAEIPVPWLGEADGGLGRVPRTGTCLSGGAASGFPCGASSRPAWSPTTAKPSAASRHPSRRLVAEVRRRPELVAFFRRAWAPDELLLSSMAMASPMAGDVSDDNLWLTKWAAGSSHAALLGWEDVRPELIPGMGGAKLFARKFDLSSDPEVLDLIDACLLARA